MSSRGRIFVFIVEDAITVPLLLNPLVLNLADPHLTSLFLGLPKTYHRTPLLSTRKGPSKDGIRHYA